MMHIVYRIQYTDFIIRNTGKIQMEIPSLPSVFDATECFLDTALNDGEYLQPMKMQYLMYLAQGYYAAACGGKRFIPSVFVATERGPVEPNSYRLYASARPVVQYQSIDRKAIAFMETIWRRFGAYSAEWLFRTICGHAPYARAFAAGAGTEIEQDDMTAFYSGKQSDFSKTAPLSGMRVLRTGTGKTVAVKKWTPVNK